MDVTDNHAEPPVSLELTPTSETKACAFDQEVTLAFNVNLKAPIRAENGTELVRKPVDIVCVIDVSSSMAGEPLELVKKSLHFLAQNLNEDDRLSLIVFSKQARIVFGLMALKGDENRLLVEHHINSLKPELWTNIGDGLFQGLSELQRARTDAVSSLLLFTDGKPTNGIKDMNVLVEMASRGASMLKGSTTLHTFGFSSAHDPALLTKLSEVANGVFYYVSAVDKIPEIFADCLGGLLSVVAVDIQLLVEIEEPLAQIDVIHSAFPITYLVPSKQARISMGQMYSEQSRDVLVNVKLAKASEPNLDVKILRFTLTHRDYMEHKIETTAIGMIDRVSSGNPDIHIVNENVLQQKARWTTIAALREALRLKGAGQSEQALKTLKTAQNSLGKFRADYQAEYKAAIESVSSATPSSAAAEASVWSAMRSHSAQQSAATDTNPRYVNFESPSYGNSAQKSMRSAASESKKS